MPKPLSTEQLATLRAVPLGSMPNRLRIALALATARQAEICEETGLTPSQVSDLVNGNYSTVILETGQRIAAFFGPECTTDDLFPPKQGVAA